MMYTISNDVFCRFKLYLLNNKKIICIKFEFVITIGY